MLETIKELIGKKIKLHGSHAGGIDYNHGEGEITDVWPVDGVFGFRFERKNGTGRVWPGIDSIELRGKNEFKFNYKNAFGEQGHCIIVLLDNKKNGDKKGD